MRQLFSRHLFLYIIIKIEMSSSSSTSNFNKLVLNLEEVMDNLFKDFYNIELQIIDYDDKNKNGADMDILAKRLHFLHKYSDSIVEKVERQDFKDIDNYFVKFFDYIRDNYYKSTKCDFQGFLNYNANLREIIVVFKACLYNIYRFQNNKSINDAYPIFPKSFKADLFKLKSDSVKRKSSSIDTYVSSVSSNGNHYKFKSLKTDVKIVKKLMGMLKTNVKNAKVNKAITEIMKTNGLNKKFVSLYKSICKSLDKNKDATVNKIMKKLRKLDIIYKIEEFHKYLEEERINHIAEFKKSVLNSFFTMKLTKSSTIPNL